MGAWLLALCLVGAAADGDAYQWPLDLPRVLTSSFAEYRPGRFHMGIDLRTGPVGKDVHATADGEVVRIRCSPYGYGKAIYLRLDDGRTAIFAHLNDFAPTFRTHLQREQHRRKSYTVDLYPGEGAFPVTRGQVIGQSGQTGIGVPHLHWEIRDTNGVPVNPRLLGIQWPDTTAPVIRKVLVEPASPDTRIDGDVFPVVLEVTGGLVVDRGTNPLRISGPVVFGVDVVDPANGGGTKLGVHTIETRSESMGRLFTMRHDRISYEHDGDSTIAYNPAYMDEGRFLMQWHHPQNRAELYDDASHDGVYAPSPGKDAITVTARDFYDNQTQLSLAVESTPWSPPTSPAAGQAGIGHVYYDNVREWLVVSVEFDAPESVMPKLWVEDLPGDTEFFRISDTVFRAVFVPDEKFREVTLSVEHPRAGRVSTDPDRRIAHRFLVMHHGTSGDVGAIGGIEIAADADSAYGTLILTAGQISSKGAPGLEAVGPAYQLWPAYGPIRAPLAVTFPLPESAEDANELSVYRQGKKSWVWMDSEAVNGRLAVSATTLGTFQIMRDTTPPVVQVRTLHDGDRLVSRPVISADVHDDGSGILSWAAYWNREWLLMAYDPEQKRIEWEQDVDLPAGPGDLMIRVTDRAGRTTEKRLALVVDP